MAEEIVQPGAPQESTLKTADQLKAENDALEREIDRAEKLKSRQIVAGRSEGFVPPKIETPEEKWAREAKQRYAGTGLDPTPSKR